MHSFTSKGRLFILDEPKVMGILNITPDSFFAGSRITEQHIVDRAGNMIEEGAAVLDIGGQSTRPGSVQISAEEELERVITAIESVKSAFPSSWISIDTYYHKVAKEAVKAGADMVNDISAGDDDENMLALVGSLGIPYIAMHKQGRPETMQQNPQYGHVTTDVIDYFIQKAKAFEAAGIHDWILDPGFGFGKTLAHNYTLLRELETLQVFDRPILVGLSRKGMIQKVLDTDAAGALPGTMVLNTMALERKAMILRVHDVKEALDCIKLYKALKPT
jgi:dihydropteroate synthase